MLNFTISFPLVLLVIYISIIVFIGIINRRNKNQEEYFLASRKLPSWLLAITFIASWWGGGSAIDVVDHAHTNGLNSFWIYGMPVLLSTFLMFVFAKGIRNVSTLTQPQIMEKRYTKQASLLLTLLIILFMTLTAAGQIVAIGKFFQSFFNIEYSLAAYIGTLLVIFYSMFGGFKGVVATDLFQFVFFLITAIAVFIISYKYTGDFNNVKTMAIANNKQNYTSFFHNITDNLVYVITFGASWMIQANVWQRISAAKTPNQAKKMMGLSFFIFIPLYLIVTLTGMLSSTFISEIPEGGIVPHIIKNYVPPLVSSILFVGLCSAIMSTMDSLINTGALSLTIDVYKKYINSKASTKDTVFVGRISTIIIGLLALLIALGIQSLLKVSWIGADLIASTVFVPLVLGFIWKKGSNKATIASILFGICFSTYNLLIFLGVDLPTMWSHESTIQAILGISGSAIVFISVSLLDKSNSQKAELFIKQAGIIKTKK